MTTTLKPRLHPLLATAALAVTAFSVAGLAALTGVLPMTRAATSTATSPAPLVTAAAVPPAPTLPAAQPRPAPRVQVEEAQPQRAPVRRVSRSEPAVAEPAVIAAAPAPAVIPPAALPPAPCMSCGTIENVREVVQPGEANGLGAVVGGVLGGVLGKQVGKGGGNTIATVLGVAGGAYAGHQIEKSRNQATRYEIGVRMHDGTLRSVTEERMPAWRVGERVRIENGVLQYDNSGNASALPMTAYPQGQNV